MGNIEDDTVLPADLPEESIQVVDGNLLEEPRIPASPDDRVPEDVHHPGFPARVQERDLVTHGLVRLAR